MRKFGGELIVGVSTDDFNEEKGKRCVIPYEQRAEIVLAIKGVSKVIPETSWEQKKIDIEKYGVTKFVMGSDWLGKFDYLRDYCEVIYLERTSGVSTTKLKDSLDKISSISKNDISDALDVLDRLRSDLF
jgi:glycerol-3-phosphate cytidylyltransferase